MNEEKKLIKCPACNKLVKNAFRDPYDYALNISMYHSPRSDKEYDFKCPECNAVYIFPSEPNP